VPHGKNPGDQYTVLTNWQSDMGDEHKRALVPPAHLEQSPNRGIVQQKGRILVVEPNDLIVGLLERWLGEAGYIVVVETSQSLPQAVTKGGEPQLVIIDVPTPRSAEKIINSVKEVLASPILLLSARFRRGMGSSISVARQFGVRNVLPKPFTRGELLSAVADSIDV
jgi:CheY-like chemotaxis protein